MVRSVLHCDGIRLGESKNCIQCSIINIYIFFKDFSIAYSLSLLSSCYAMSGLISGCELKPAKRVFSSCLCKIGYFRHNPERIDYGILYPLPKHEHIRWQKDRLTLLL